MYQSALFQREHEPLILSAHIVLFSNCLHTRVRDPLSRSEAGMPRYRDALCRPSTVSHQHLGLACVHLHSVVCRVTRAFSFSVIPDGEANSPYLNTPGRTFTTTGRLAASGAGWWFLRNLLWGQVFLNKTGGKRTHMIHNRHSKNTNNYYLKK